MHSDTYKPVPHDEAFRAQLLDNPEVQTAFAASATEYAILLRPPLFNS